MSEANNALLAGRRRQARIRRRVQGTAEMPRLTVFRSNKFIYAQLINDAAHQTLLGVSEKVLGAETKTPKLERARSLGQEVAKLATTKQITKVVFDKGRYAYHGRVKAFAEGAREGGLRF